jgi:hypothetical protein
MPMPAKTQRNLEIVRWWLDGDHPADIALAYGLSRQRVLQILAAYLQKHPINPALGQAKILVKLEAQERRLAQRKTLRAERELRHNLMAQARVAGYIAPARLQVHHLEPLLTREDFVATEEDGRDAPRFDLSKLEGFGNGEN